jgi:hypothetical protein
MQAAHDAGHSAREIDAGETLPIGIAGAPKLIL